MPSLPEGTVTFLFTDIQGSTKLLAELGSEDYHELLTVERSLVRAAVDSAGGHELGTEGDSHFVVFATARDAIKAAVGAQRALRAHRWPSGATIDVRMGMHTGEATLTEEGYVGLDVHRAARVGSAGHGGQILVSAATHALAGEDFLPGTGFKDLGPARLKDFEGAERLYQVVADDLPDHFPPLKSLASPTNLPQSLSPLVGRVAEVETLTQLLSRADVRLVTLTGPGGMGKTRLALEAAGRLLDRFDDGVFLVALATVASPDLVVPTVAEALGVPVAGGTAPEDAVKDHLGNRDILVVLDNFEQLLPAAPMVATLLRGAPGLKVLVTNRTVLRLSGEHEFAVPPLSLPDPSAFGDPAGAPRSDAVELFYRRARAVRPDFRPAGADAVAVAEICVHLDGLPLAIELAAARVGLLPPRAMLERLDKKLSVLTSGPTDLPERQRTLRATVDWSYELLDEEEKRYFRHAAVFPGGFTLDLAEAILVSSNALDVLSGIASLMEKSLLFQRDDGAATPRFRMLRTIREYANEMLASDPEEAVLRRRFADQMLQFAEELQEALRGAEQATALRALGAELDNLRAVFSWMTDSGETLPALRLAAALGRFWYARGQPVEGSGWLEQAVARAPDAPMPVRAKALQLLGVLLDQRAEYERARDVLEQALTLARRSDDPARAVASLNSLAIVARSSGDIARARKLLEECLPLRRALGDRAGLASSITNLGIVAMDEGDLDRAHELYSEALAMDRANDDPWGIAVGLNNLGAVHLERRDLTEARSHLSRAVAMFDELGDDDGIAESLEVSAGVAAAEGKAVWAARLAGAADALRASLGTQLGTTDRARLDRYLAPARDSLGEEAFAAAWDEGKVLPLGRLKAYAQGQVDDVGALDLS